MADNKKYYYLKLKDNFFESDEMIILESMQDGYLYSNILLKLYLRSLKNEGRLMFNDRIPFNSTMLAQVTRHSVGDVEKAMKVFQELELIEVLDNGAIYVTDIQNFIGQSSTEGDRKRAYRARIQQEQRQLKPGKGQMSDKRPPEIEIEIEIEREINTSCPVEQDEALYSDIINYLNKKAGRSFKPTTLETRELIKKRLEEGYKLKDFEKVVDVKVKDWIEDEERSKYLRPETLFGPKFESYLNQESVVDTKAREKREEELRGLGLKL